MQAIHQGAHSTHPNTRRFACLATLALGLAGSTPTAHATLQVYEGFNYTVVPGTGSLNGQTGGIGMTGSWSAANTNTYPNNSPTGFSVCNAATQTWWNGSLTSVPQTGN